MAKFKEPKQTVKAYKLFRVDQRQPGKLFPLFVHANQPVELDKWHEAQIGEMTGDKVKSKIGPLAFRPGWHAGDLPVATHIGENSDPANRPNMPPDTRPANHVWAEVEMPDDVDWQTVADERGTNAQGRVVPVKAHITDQIPSGGHYRYKTNSNMTGNWLIGGAMKVNKVLNDKEVKAINKAAGVSDLPRAQPFSAKRFGFAGGGSVGKLVIPDYVKNEELANYRNRTMRGYADGGEVDPYQGSHKPPSESYGAPLHDLTNIYPEDIYSSKALNLYGMGHPEHKKMDMESLFKAQLYRNKPNASVSIFRAVPENINEINPKDWVTLSPMYAKLHGESRLGGKYKVLKKMVKAKELWTAGDSIHEWGYHPTEKAEGGVVYMAKGGSLTVEEMRRAIAKASGSNPPMAEKNLITTQDFHTSLMDKVREGSINAKKQMDAFDYKYDKGHRVFTEDSAKKNRAPYEILERHRHGNQLMWEGRPWNSKKIIDPDTGKAKRTPYEPAYRVRGEIGEMILPESAIKGRVDMARGGLVHMAEGGSDWKPHPENDLLQPIGSSKMVGDEKLVSDDGAFKSGLSMFPSSKKSYRYVYHDEDQKPIGAMQIATQGPRSKKAVIQNLYVAEANRRQGIASKLLDRARKDFDVKHSDDLTTAGKAFAKAKKAHGGRVTHAHHLDIEERPL